MCERIQNILLQLMTDFWQTSVDTARWRTAGGHTHACPRVWTRLLAQGSFLVSKRNALFRWRTTDWFLNTFLKGAVCNSDAEWLTWVLQVKFMILSRVVSAHLPPRVEAHTCCQVGDTERTWAQHFISGDPGCRSGQWAESQKEMIRRRTDIWKESSVST